MGLLKNIVSFWRLYGATDLSAAAAEAEPPPSDEPPIADHHDEDPSAIRARIAELSGVEHMTVAVDRDACIGCGACAVSCPNSAITIDDADETAHITQDNCVTCGACVATCPTEAIRMLEE